MARWDIRPYDLESGRHRIRHFLLDPTVTGAVDTLAEQDTSHLEGNIVSVDPAVGDILVADDGAFDPATGLHLIAAVSSQGMITHNNLADPVAAAGPRMLPCYDVTTGAEFSTSIVSTNAGAAGDTALDLTAAVFVGMSADFWVNDTVATAIGHRHYIDVNGDFFIITRKLDALGRDSDQSGQACVQVVFKSNT